MKYEKGQPVQSMLEFADLMDKYELIIKDLHSLAVKWDEWTEFLKPEISSTVYEGCANDLRSLITEYEKKTDRGV